MRHVFDRLPIIKMVSVLKLTLLTPAPQPRVSPRTRSLCWKTWPRFRNPSSSKLRSWSPRILRRGWLLRKCGLLRMNLLRYFTAAGNNRCYILVMNRHIGHQRRREVREGGVARGRPARPHRIHPRRRHLRGQARPHPRPWGLPGGRGAAARVITWCPRDLRVEFRASQCRHSER